MRSRVALLLFSAAGFHGSVVGAPLDLTANVRPNDAAISASALGQIPLGFERGCRSHDPDIYHASGLSYHVTVAADRMAVRLVRLGSAAAPGHEASPPRSDLVRLRFIDANTRARSEALDTQPGYANYLKSNDTARACTDVTRFSRVRFSDVYPAIDLVYYGDGRELEFDVLLRPGADPRRVRFVVEPATDISVSAEGDLDVDVGGEALKLRRPVAYQQIAGRRVAVKTDFVLTDGVVSLRIADYDTAAELVVDPVLSYGTYLGGALKDYGTAAAVDAAGNLFVAGYTTSADFPTLSFFDKTLGTNDVDAFVLKLAATGKTLIYSTLLGGTGIDRAMGIAIDATGNAYVTGVTSGGFPTTAGAYQTTSTATNSFVTKLAPAGNALVYSTYVQGVEANGIAIDASGSAYVTGKVVTAITPTAGAYRSAPAGAFVVKLNPAGTAASYATYLGGGGAETATGIAVDTSGNAYVAGTTSPDQAARRRRRQLPAVFQDGC